MDEMSSSSGCDPRFWEQMVELHRIQLLEDIKASDILKFIPCLSEYSVGIINLEETNQNDANDFLIELLQTSDGNWYIQLTDALYKGGYEKLAKRLDTKNMHDIRTFKGLIEKCLSYICEMKPDEILKTLRRSGTISDEDFDEIRIIQDEKGNDEAMLELVMCLPRHNVNWFAEFREALQNHKENRVLSRILSALPFKNVELRNEAGSSECDVRTEPLLAGKLVEQRKTESKDLSLPRCNAGAETKVKQGSSVQKETRIKETVVVAESKDFSLPKYNAEAETKIKQSGSSVQKETRIKEALVDAESKDFSLPKYNAEAETKIKLSGSSVQKETQIKEAIAKPGSSPVAEPRARTSIEKESSERSMPINSHHFDVELKNIIDNLKLPDENNDPDDNCDLISLRSCNTQPSTRSKNKKVMQSPSDGSGLHSDPVSSQSSLGLTRDDNSSASSSKSMNAAKKLAAAGKATMKSVAKKPNIQEEECRQVLVSGLRLGVERTDVIDHFGMIGDIERDSNGAMVQLRRNNTEAIVTYVLHDVAKFAVDCFNGSRFKDCDIQVKLFTQDAVPERDQAGSRPREFLSENSSDDSTFRTSTSSQAGRSVNEKIKSEKKDPAAERGDEIDPPDLIDVHVGGAARDDEEEQPNPLGLRRYQQELAAKAVEGKSCIIVAPTGSGKTHVAMEIIRNHDLDRKRRGLRKPTKIAFVVPAVALVEQQKRLFERNLCELSVIGQSGGEVDKLPLSFIMEHQDIVVLTPQILENALKENVIKSLAEFTLIIFDECHHTNKSHPYNQIMSHYIDEKFDNAERGIRSNLPQIVGLTASVGVGKAIKLDDAVEYILGLCANLDAEAVCTVVENVEELKRNVNRPDETTNEVQGRAEDPFYDRITEIMKTIEDKMRRSREMRTATEENPEFSRVVNAPYERGSEPYIQWISRIIKAVDQISDQTARRFFVACIRRLKIYNTALMINSDCRTKDAVHYIEEERTKEFNPMEIPKTDSSNYLDGTDKWLNGLYDEALPGLLDVSEDPRYENPKLNILKNIILDRYEEKPDSCGIIFCKTREMTVALVNWMKEDGPELNRLHPHNITGSNAPQHKAGMTAAKQEDVLQYFKDGEHKLIVATSVAEEGLDVRKCNIVIRYEHVTNTTARIQARGRARAEQGQYVLLAERGRGAAKKDRFNKFQETLMEEAINVINNYSPRRIREEVRAIQKKTLIERQAARQASSINKALKQGQLLQGDFTLRCEKCDNFCAYSYAIRKVEDAHHVVLDKDFIKQIDVRPYPTPKKFQTFEVKPTGKIFCKKCNSDWGIMALYKKVPFPVIKISSFIIIDERDKRTRCKQWKMVPFQVMKIQDAELLEHAKVAARHYSMINDVDLEDEIDLFSYFSDNDSD